MIEPADRGRAAGRLLFGGFLAIFWVWLGFSLLMLQGFYYEHSHGDPQPLWAFGVIGGFVAVGAIGVVAGTRSAWRAYRLLLSCLPADARPVEEQKRAPGEELTAWSFRFTALDGSEHTVYRQGLYRDAATGDEETARLYREGGTELVLYHRDDPGRALLASDLPSGFTVRGRNLVDVSSALPLPLYLLIPLLAVGVNGWVLLSFVAPGLA